MRRGCAKPCPFLEFCLLLRSEALSSRWGTVLASVGETSRSSLVRTFVCAWSKTAVDIRSVMSKIFESKHFPGLFPGSQVNDHRLSRHVRWFHEMSEVVDRW